jgi:hypothetical protein
VFSTRAAARGQDHEQKTTGHRRGSDAPHLTMSHRAMLASLSGHLRQITDIRAVSGGCRILPPQRKTG